MKTISLNEQSFLVDQKLSDFTIYQKPSSNVDFFGIDHVNNKLFVQFKGGSGCYIYSGLPDQLLADIPFAESIGKLISACVVNKFISEKIANRLVIPANRPTQTEPSF